MDEIRREIADRTPGGDITAVSHAVANTWRCQKFPSGNMAVPVVRWIGERIAQADRTIIDGVRNEQ